MKYRKRYAFIAIPLIALLVMGQVFGPVIFTPFLTVGTGTRATTGNLQVNGAITATGAITVASCTGCSGGGVTQSTASFSTTWPNGCTTTPSSDWNYTLTGNVVTVDMVTGVSCTSDSTTFNTSGGTGFPVAIRPATSKGIGIVKVFDGGTTPELNPGCIQLTNTGAVFINTTTTAFCDGSWTASSTKGYTALGFNMNSFTYTLD